MMVSATVTIRSLASAGLLAVLLGLGAPVLAAPSTGPRLQAGADIVPVRQDVPWWLIPDGRDRERWNDDWDDDDRRDRRRHRARERCLDRDPIARHGHWYWDHGECRWQNGRPER